MRGPLLPLPDPIPGSIHLVWKVLQTFLQRLTTPLVFPVLYVLIFQAGHVVIERVAEVRLGEVYGRQILPWKRGQGPRDRQHRPAGGTVCVFCRLSPTLGKTEMQFLTGGSEPARVHRWLGSDCLSSRH